MEECRSAVDEEHDSIHSRWPVRRHRARWSSLPDVLACSKSNYTVEWQRSVDLLDRSDARTGERRRASSLHGSTHPDDKELCKKQRIEIIHCHCQCTVASEVYEQGTEWWWFQLDGFVRRDSRAIVSAVR